MGSRPNQLQSVAESSGPRPSASSASSKKPFLQGNKKVVIIPTLACLLFVYGITSIRAAKANAQRHRDADTGGEGLSLLNESRRRHGMEGKIQGSGNTITELAREGRAQLLGEKSGEEDQKKEQSGTGRSENEEKLRDLRGTRSRSREG